MNKILQFNPQHINATQYDLAGNDGLGRYILLPGSDGRAKAIANYFNEVTVKPHPRGHNLYLGTLSDDDATIEVAVIASGMGCPSMEIILHELFHLGGRRFLRLIKPPFIFFIINDGKFNFEFVFHRPMVCLLESTS